MYVTSIESVNGVYLEIISDLFIIVLPSVDVKIAITDPVAFIFA